MATLTVKEEVPSTAKRSMDADDSPAAKRARSDLIWNVMKSPTLESPPVVGDRLVLDASLGSWRDCSFAVVVGVYTTKTQTRYIIVTAPVHHAPGGHSDPASSEHSIAAPPKDHLFWTFTPPATPLTPSRLKKTYLRQHIPADLLAYSKHYGWYKITPKEEVRFAPHVIHRVSAAQLEDEDVMNAFIKSAVSIQYY